jgi:hypothetical protein
VLTVKVADRLDGLADLLRHRALDALGDEVGHQLSNDGVVLDGRHDPALRVPVAGRLVQERVTAD